MNTSPKKEAPASSQQKKWLVAPKILYVEDDDISHILIKRVLTDLGCDIAFEKNPTDALERIKAEYFDLIMTDLIMPGMSGIDLTKSIRHMEKSIHAENRLPIVGLTARQINKIMDDCKEAGMDDVVAKPINAQVAEKILNKFITDTNQKPSKKPLQHDRPALYMLQEYLLLDTEEGLMIAGDEPTLNKFLKTLADVIIPKGIADLRLAHMQGDWRVIYEITNDLKGNALNCGAKRLRYACENIENYYDSNNTHLLEKLFQQLIHTMFETQSSLLP